MVNAWGYSHEYYAKQYEKGTLLEHSEIIEDLRDHRTLWLRIKNRFSNDIVRDSDIIKIFDWSEAIGAMTGRSCSRQYEVWRRHSSIQFCNNFYTAVLPRNDWQWTAIKIAWGEYFSERNI